MKVVNQIILGLAFSCASFLLCFNFVHTGKYAQYPWWHEHGNDSDGTYAAQTVTLVNGLPLSYLHHPGATVYSIDAIAYRIMSQFPSYHHILGFSKVKSLDEASNILESAVRISRVTTLMIALIAVLVFILLARALNSHSLVIFIGIIYMITTRAFIQHSYKVRPELLSLVFMLGAWFVLTRMFKKAQVPLRHLVVGGISAGFLLTASILSKIQTGPLVALTVGIIAYICVQHKGMLLETTPKRKLKVFLILFGISIIFMPWWALIRPAFLTPEFLHSLYYLSDDLRVYGKAPANFIGLVALTEISILISALIARRYITSFVCLQALMAGAIVCVYLILIPASSNLHQYIENTQHLVYAVLTNVTQGGFLINKDFGPQTFQKIYTLHQTQSSVLGVHLLWIVGIAFIASIIRLIIKSSLLKNYYRIVVMVFCSAMLMDIFATMRWQILFEYYMVYSVVLYTLGLAVWVSLELKSIKPRWGKYVLGFVLGYVFIMHGFRMSVSFCQDQPATGISKQDPMLQVHNVQSHVPLYWLNATAQ